MATAEPAPNYEGERSGTDQLESVFYHAHRDEYEGAVGKAAYIFCSTIDGHHFSNGNKRLAVTLLTYFLLINGYKIHAPNLAVMREQLQSLFPHVRWEADVSFQSPHEYFFYHLALIIADRSQKGEMTFLEEREAVMQLLSVVAIRE